MWEWEGVDGGGGGRVEGGVTVNGRVTAGVAGWVLSVRIGWLPVVGPAW